MNIDLMSPLDPSWEAPSPDLLSKWHLSNRALTEAEPLNLIRYLYQESLTAAHSDETISSVRFAKLLAFFLQKLRPTAPDLVATVLLTLLTDIDEISIPARDVLKQMVGQARHQATRLKYRSHYRILFSNYDLLRKEALLTEDFEEDLQVLTALFDDLFDDRSQIPPSLLKRTLRATLERIDTWDQYTHGPLGAGLPPIALEDSIPDLDLFASFLSTLPATEFEELYAIHPLATALIAPQALSDERTDEIISSWSPDSLAIFAQRLPKETLQIWPKARLAKLLARTEGRLGAHVLTMLRSALAPAARSANGIRHQ